MRFLGRRLTNFYTSEKKLVKKLVEILVLENGNHPQYLD